MKLAICIAAALIAWVGAATAAEEVDESSSDRKALEIMDEFMLAFNAGDVTRWAGTLNYPHVRIAGGKVTLSQNAREYAGRFSFDEFRRRTGWHHSAWDEKKIVQTSADKVHIAVQFTRYRADGGKIASYRSLYIVTNDNGHWGVQARSSFAP